MGTGDPANFFGDLSLMIAMVWMVGRAFRVLTINKCNEFGGSSLKAHYRIFAAGGADGLDAGNAMPYLSSI
jgi:hypothetical protein